MGQFLVLQAISAGSPAAVNALHPVAHFRLDLSNLDTFPSNRSVALPGLHAHGIAVSMQVDLANGGHLPGRMGLAVIRAQAQLGVLHVVQARVKSVR